MQWHRYRLTQQLWCQSVQRLTGTTHSHIWWKNQVIRPTNTYAELDILAHLGCSFLNLFREDNQVVMKIHHTCVIKSVPALQDRSKMESIYQKRSSFTLVPVQCKLARGPSTLLWQYLFDFFWCRFVHTLDCLYSCLSTCNRFDCMSRRVCIPF